MKNLLTGFVIFALMLAFVQNANAGYKLSRHKYVASDMTEQSSGSNSSEMYSDDLIRVELYLYHKTYSKYSLANRLGRIERTIFRQTYPSMTYSERVNNILSCYRDTYNMKNYAAGYYSANPFRRMYSRYYGYPTGLTPPVTQTVFGNAVLPRYQNMYYNNRGYRYNNMTHPMTGIGVHILD